MTEKIKKNIGLKHYVGGLFAVGMIGVMGYDQIMPLFEKNTTTQHAFEDSLLSETQTQPLNTAFESKVEPVQPVSVASHVEVVNVDTANGVTHVVPAYTLDLPESTQTALDAIARRYQYDLQLQAIEAELRLQASQKQLELLTQKASITPVATTETPIILALTPQAQADKLTLKSVVSTPHQNSAWFELDGQIFPVQVGAWIDDLKVHRLSNNSVLLLDKNGKEHVKYMAKAKNTDKAVESDNAESDAWIER